MRSMHHISVDRADGGASLEEALRYLKDGEVVGIFPEATISRSFEVKELKSGATRIAAAGRRAADPGGAVGHPAADDQGPPARLLARQDDRDPRRRADVPRRRATRSPRPRSCTRGCSDLLDEAIDAYPDEEQPPGSWWLPASRGGSAPTPERGGLELDAEEKARRRRRPSAAARPSGDDRVSSTLCRQIDESLRRPVGQIAQIGLSSRLRGSITEHDPLEVGQRGELDGDLALAAAERDLDPGLEPVAEPVGELRQARGGRSGGRVTAAARRRRRRARRRRRSPRGRAPRCPRRRPGRRAGPGSAGSVDAEQRPGVSCARARRRPPDAGRQARGSAAAACC